MTIDVAKKSAFIAYLKKQGILLKSLQKRRKLPGVEPHPFFEKHLPFLQQFRYPRFCSDNHRAGDNAACIAIL